MRVTPEQREAWLRDTAASPFNRWLNAQVRNLYGTLDLDKLHAVAMEFGVDKRDRYAHLNPGQQRMSVGNLLRKIVPESTYLSAADRVIDANEDMSTRKPTAKRQAMLPISDRPGSITGSSVRQLLETYGQVLDELRHRGVVRTANSPGGDYAELLFSRAFDWTLASNSATGWDAEDRLGRYQIKSRRLTQYNGSRQLSALRNLPDRHFDWLAGVLFHADYTVYRAALIPYELVEPRCRFSTHTKAWLFFLDDAVWSLPGVRDVTSELSDAAGKL
jgi:hypothetical protein